MDQFSDCREKVCLCEISSFAGLFRHAIMMSGSPLSYWAIMNDQVKPVYQRKVQIYLKSVGCVFGDITNVKRCLKSKHVSDLTRYLRVSETRAH